MRLGHAVWRALPRLPSTAAAGAAKPEPVDFLAAAEGLGLGPKLARKPWALLSDARAGLEEALDLATDELLVALAGWLEASAGAPACVGLAHVSGNVYFGPSLDLGVARLSPEQVLVANLFSHGEIGLDAVVSRAPPGAASTALLRELATYKQLRWLDAASPRTGEPSSARAARVPRRLREAGLSIRPVSRSALSRHPLASEVASPAEAVGGTGDCLQHPEFTHRDISGSGIEELQASLARIAAARAYRPSGGRAEPERLRAGCALRTAGGSLFAGSAIGARGGAGAVSPLETALVSVGANGAPPDSVAGAMWAVDAGAAAPAAEVAALRERDEALLAAVAPGASFMALAE